jgi:Putative lumazine-binding
MRSVIFICFTMVCNHANGQHSKTFSPDEQEVLDVINLFFKSMAEKDTVVVRQIMTSDGQYYATREQEEGNYVAMRTHEQYFQGMSSRAEVFQERMWDPTVMVHKTIAMVWTPYDFYIDGQFSHCGIDCFTLVKTEEGWKISGVVFTMEPENCEESPLGPIKRD